MKRLFDFVVALLALILLSPMMIVVMVLIWAHDRHSPLYIAARAGKGGRPFHMVKLRSMVLRADHSGVVSTAGDDKRITAIGHFIRRYKLDELAQLYNVLVGDMSLVGPRPNVQAETDLYTDEEKKLLSVRPGITDFASIVFADEGDILTAHNDPDLAYNQLIRPTKSRLGLYYIDHRSFWLDMRLCLLTVMAMVNRQKALAIICDILEASKVSPELISIARRNHPLKPTAPPGSEEIVQNR